jgi:hypothetical protein
VRPQAGGDDRNRRCVQQCDQALAGAVANLRRPAARYKAVPRRSSSSSTRTVMHPGDQGDQGDQELRTLRRG